MSQGISLHIGVRSPTKCMGLSTLVGPERDAEVMESIAKERSYSTTVLPGDKATLAALRTSIIDAASVLKNQGDTFLLTFSGHGRNSTAPPLQTWCLADHELKENELFDLLGYFSEGVRIVVVSASCHSGGFGTPIKPLPELLRDLAGKVVSWLGFEDTSAIPLMTVPEMLTPTPIKASVLLLLSCGPGENSRDATVPGAPTLFTQVLLDLWNAGGSSQTYTNFFRGVIAEVPKHNGHQHPAAAKAGADPNWRNTVLAFAP